MQIPEADLEYLIRTLSDARSRATELAVSLRSRLGSEHRLSELANAAASNVETTLREIRNAASQNGSIARAPKNFPITPQPGIHSTMNPQEAPAPASTSISFAAEAGLDSEHWLALFVDELLAQAKASGGITFERVERMLQRRKDDFLRDFLTARRMYRTYPRLFPELAEEVIHAHEH